MGLMPEFGEITWRYFGFNVLLGPTIGRNTTNNKSNLGAFHGVLGQPGNGLSLLVEEHFILCHLEPEELGFQFALQVIYTFVPLNPLGPKSAVTNWPVVSLELKLNGFHLDKANKTAWQLSVLIKKNLLQTLLVSMPILFLMEGLP